MHSIALLKLLHMLKLYWCVHAQITADTSKEGHAGIRADVPLSTAFPAISGIGMAAGGKGLGDVSASVEGSGSSKSSVIDREQYARMLYNA